MSVEILPDPLRGKGSYVKDHIGLQSQGGGGGMQKNGKTEGAQKGYNYSHGQLSIGGSGNDIFIDLNRIALTKRYVILEDGLTPFLTLESNEYQLYMLKFAPNVVKKLCNLLGERARGY